MPQYSVMFGRFPFGAKEEPDVTDWLIETIIKCKLDPRIDVVHNRRKDDTPITMSRNWMVEQAKAVKADILVMIDNDMAPDIKCPGCKPFWETSLDFMLKHHGPCIIGSPYCGPPPLSNVYVFQWANWQNDNPQPDMRLEQFSREQAAQLAGITRVGALPTGLIMMDMRAFQKLKPPYFYYEWTDKTDSAKASTEDVTFTRDLDMAGVPQYCNWDAWSGHWKRLRVDKPKMIYSDHIQEKYRAAVLADIKSNERLVILGEGQDSIQEIGRSNAAQLLR